MKSSGKHCYSKSLYAGIVLINLIFTSTVVKVTEKIYALKGWRIIYSNAIVSHNWTR